MTENEWLTASEIAEKVRIPVETIRRYCRQHSHHLKIKKDHKKYNIHSESVAAIEQIRELYAAGKSIDDVEKMLEASGVPLTITVDPEREDRIEKQLQEMRERLDQQQEFNRQLLDRLDKQQKYIDSRLEERIRLEDKDRKLMEDLRGSMQSLQEEKQARLEAAAIKEEDGPQEKKGFWDRLFGK
jgi:DNA-binding transcriptional MerR regulator